MSSRLLDSYKATPQSLTNSKCVSSLMQSFSILRRATAHHRLALLANSYASSSTTPASKSRMSSSSFPPPELREIVKEVATLLKDRKETISVAETVSGPPNSNLFSPSHSTLYSHHPLGSRRPHLLIPPLLPRRLNLLPRRPNPLHARIAQSLRRLDRRRHSLVQGPHPSHRLQARAQHAQLAAKHVCRV